MGTIIRWAIYIFIGLVLLKLIGKLLAKYILIPIIMVLSIFILGWISSGFWNGVGCAVLLAVILLVVIGIGDDSPEPKGSSGRRSSGSRRSTSRSTLQDNDNDSAAIRAKNDKLRSLGYRIDDAEREVNNRDRDLRDAESDLQSAENRVYDLRNAYNPDDIIMRDLRYEEGRLSHYRSQVSSAKSRLNDAERKLSNLESEYRHIESYG